jgi:hypothetical protein
MIEDDELPAVKVGGCLVGHPDDYDTYIQRVRGEGSDDG